MLFQPSNISPDEINGSGCVDISQGLAVSWQVSGDSAMRAWQIDIYKNDAASTLLYSTGKTTLAEPFWGVDYKGETQYFSTEIDAAALSGAGLLNGNEYKMLITQWWSDSDSIQQMTASLFLTRSTPTVVIGDIPSPLSTKAHSFTATYTQAQGDGLNWLRWRIAEAGSKDSPFLDTGKISGTGQLRVDYDGFFTETEYAVICDVETANGIQASSGWVPFTVNYEVGAPEGSVTVCQLQNDSCVFIQWDKMDTAQGYSILRRKVGEQVLMKLADVDDTTGQLRDYGACSGQTYVYYVFPTGPLAYLTQPMVSDPIAVQFWFWAIIEAAETADKVYSVLTSYLFRVGSGGVSEGSFSNNNAPQISRNFTRYPTRQAQSSNYLTGSVSGFIGSIKNKVYSDNVGQSEKLMSLSTGENPLFLLDPKGHFLRIHTAEAISLSIDHKSPAMPQTLTFPWIEVDSTEGIALISAPGGDFYPADQVIFTTVHLDWETGELIWTVPEGYADGSVLSIRDGELVQSVEGSFVEATLRIDPDTGELIATPGG